MDVAVINWKDSKFEKDLIYEDINAPRWIDLSMGDPPVEDDETWFCRLDCSHPKTVDDFFSHTIPGRDIVNQVTEFCHELKRLATRKKENESEKKQESERTPLFNMRNIRSKDEKRLLQLQIRTNPPSPQCFSANLKATPPKAFDIRPHERGVVAEIESKEGEVKKKVKDRNTTATRNKISKQNEAKGAIDVFWFFKPCTLSS